MVISTPLGFWTETRQKKTTTAGRAGTNGLNAEYWGLKSQSGAAVFYEVVRGGDAAPMGGWVEMRGEERAGWSAAGLCLGVAGEALQPRDGR